MSEKKSRRIRASKLRDTPGAVSNDSVERNEAEKLLEAGHPATQVAKETKLPYCNVAAMARSFPRQAKGRTPGMSILHRHSRRALEALLAYRNEQTAHWWNVKTATTALKKEFDDSITERKTRIFLGWSGISEDSIRVMIEDSLKIVREREIKDINKQKREIEGRFHDRGELLVPVRELARLQAPDRSSKYFVCYTLVKSPTRVGWPTIRVYATRGLRGHGKSEFFRVTLANDSPLHESLPRWGGRPPVKVFSNVNVLPANHPVAENQQQVLVHLEAANRLILSEAEEGALGFLLV